MKLAIPIFKDKEIFTDIEIEKPRSKILANSHEALVKSGPFRAIFEFLVGCTSALITKDNDIVSDKSSIRNLIELIPYVSAEAVAIKIMALLTKDDKIEGIYTCPRCGKNFIAEYDSVIKEDKRDKVGDLKIIHMENEINNFFEIQLNEKVTIKRKDTGEILQEISSIKMHHPTLRDCISSFKNNVEGQDIRTQNRIYISCIEEINSVHVDKTWKFTFGKILMEELFPEDLFKIGKEVQKYGLVKKIQRECMNCGKVWEAPINTDNFFVSGLLPQ